MTGPAIRAWDRRDFDVAALVEAKAGTHVSVCLPARDEAATVGPIVAAIQGELVERCALVDEVLVVDDGSSDDTAEVARAAGAAVVSAADVLPGHGPAGGKGDALWRSLYASKGDIVVFCDADVRDFDPIFVTGLLGPLLVEPSVQFVKGFYRRPLKGVEGEGGRVTELVARPLVSLLFPELVAIAQPLAGEFAGRREVLEQVPFVRGYGVDLGLVVDVFRRCGLSSIAQVDLGSRAHRNRSLEELGAEALAVLHVALRRGGVGLATDAAPVLSRPGLEPVAVETGERPPMVEISSYRYRH